MELKRTIQEPLTDRIFLICVYLFLSVIFIAVTYPLLYIVSSSFSSSDAVLNGKVWLWPVQPTLNGYEAVYNYPQIFKGMINSVFYTILSVFLTVSLTVLMGYPLSRKKLAGKNVLSYLLLFAMIFHGGLIPFYLV